MDSEEQRAPPLPWYARDSLAQWLSTNRWYTVLVVLPTLIAALYFGLIAASRYESEARFVVRSPSSTPGIQLGNIVQGGGIVRSSDDAYIVHAYMKSRDAVRALSLKQDLVARLSRPEADFLWRYPSFFATATEEKLWQHFQSLISIDFDSSTGITTLRAQAFRPEDAQAIALGLIESAEQLINTMSARAQKETLSMATREVQRTRAAAQDALEKMTAFRKAKQLIDPSRMSSASLELIARLAYEKALTKAELDEMQSLAADSPQAKTLQRRISAYEEQIAAERKALAGTDGSLAPIIAEYERLVLERQFAERTFASAQAALDIARVDSERQKLFIERISSPSKPDYPKYPYRMLDTLGLFALTSLLFAVGRRLSADARGHAGR